MKTTTRYDDGDRIDIFRFYQRTFINEERERDRQSREEEKNRERGHALNIQDRIEILRSRNVLENN